MGVIQSLAQWYANSSIGTATISVPALETSVLFLILTFCLLFRFSRTGLIVAYVFIYRWGWAFCREALERSPQSQHFYSTAYLVFGVLVLTFAIIGMLHAARTEI